MRGGGKAFDVPGSENRDIYTMAPGGSDLQQVTTSPFSDTDAVCTQMLILLAKSDSFAPSAHG